MHLRGRKPGPARVLHGFKHIGDEAADVGRTGVGHRLGPLQQDGVAHASDFQDGHEGEIWCARPDGKPDQLRRDRARWNKRCSRPATPAGIRYMNAIRITP